MMGRSVRLSRAGFAPNLVKVLLLLLLYAQLLFSASLKSPTIDEPNHLTRGYAYLKTGDARLSRDEGHPPLFNLLCAIPLSLLRDLSLPLDRQSWQTGFRNAFAIEFIFGQDVPLRRIFFLGRLPVMGVTLCLAALVARWAGELYGSWGSVVALLFCAFDPNLIAHGRLVTTDVGSAFMFALTLYLFWRFLHAPSPGWLILSGLILGTAQGVKFSMITLLPFMGLLGLIAVAHPQTSLHLPKCPRVAGKRWLSALLALGGAMAAAVTLAGLTVWAIYGFRVGQPAGWSIAVPAPLYVEGFEKTLSHASEIGHPAFLMGRRSTHGWWYYFPVAFLLKTPLPALIALVCVWLSNAWVKLSHAEWPLLVVPIIYLGLSTRSILNIGYRHLLPMLPFLWVYVGRVGPFLQTMFSCRKGWPAACAVVGAAMLGLWLVVGTLGVAPDYLAYFNALAGGPDGGWRYLVDSNLDWGQDLWALETYLERHPPSRVHLSWFGCTYPHLYGLDLEYRLLPSHFSYPYPRDAARSPYNPLFPAPGLYAIGATNLNGVGLAAGDVFKGFRKQEPIARVGHSIHIYEVPDSPGSSNPTCISGLRFKDLTDETEAWSLGRGPGPVKWFDHTSSFILPGAGDPAYVVPTPPLNYAPVWQAAFLARAERVHSQAEAGEKPAAAVYRLDRASADAWLAEALGSVSTAPVGWSPSIVFDSSAQIHPLSAPVSFQYGLELVGYTLVSGRTLRPGQTLGLITVWRSTAEMPAAAADLTVFVHLLDDHSRMWGAEDRLDLHPATWEPGDVLFQYHRVPLAADAPPGTYQLEVGSYAAITLRRLSVYAQGVPVGDRLLLQPIDVVAP